MGNNHLKISQGFRVLLESFAPYIARELGTTFGVRWWTVAVMDVLRAEQKRNLPHSGEWATLVDSLDISLCLLLFDLHWNTIFRNKLSMDNRTWAKELLGVRNRLAHIGSNDFSDEDTWRALDTMMRLCKSIDPEAVEEIKDLSKLPQRFQTDALSNKENVDNLITADEFCATQRFSFEETNQICPEELKITCNYNETVNFAMQQNDVPIIRKLSIKNLSDNTVNNLKITVSTDPDIAEEWFANIVSLAPEQEHFAENVNLRLSATKLYELTERVNGTLAVVISDEAGVISQEKFNIAFLSYDEWSGKNTYPEFLSAFVTPNHSYIVEIIKKASRLLEKWMGSPSFTGYQSKNPNNAKKQMAAIYGALQQENIAYCMPPASFEVNGQKVRLSGAIQEQKLGTCLDLALLYAGCLEATGLNPLIVIIKGHAFVGCWLEEETFAECVQDDVSALTKRIADGINEICVVEATSFATGNETNFEGAVFAAERHLSKPDDFVYLVDVKRSRSGGIRPIPQRREDGSFSFDDEYKKSGVTDSPTDFEIFGKPKYVDSIEFSKQQMWERKLLDLSLRNSLLNFRVTKNSIQLFVNSLGDLEDALSDGDEFQIMHRPMDMTNSPRDNKIFESLNKESVWHTLIKSEFQNHRIRTFLDEATLAAGISSLYRSARTSIEENGANTLYLALGFLKWYESGVSEKPRYAPLILLPVDIIRKSAQRGYVFRLRDEEPQFNITLLEKLRMDHGIYTTELDPLPTDEHGIDLKRVFQIVRQLVMGKKGWDVEELAFIGIFSFTQFIMWNDIRNRVDDLKRNKIVKSLLTGKMGWDSDIAFLSPKELDETVAPSDLAVPISADSSQLAAIHAAGKGHSFVLHGPPGTGKSQTITNIIANALYQGKSVLFVAEKMAALSVVQKRLEAIGLGDFSLELHSNKARKKDVLDQLDRALNIGKIKAPENFAQEADAIFSIRQELNKFVDELHKPRQFGFSLYEAISRTEQYHNYSDCIEFSNDQICALTSHQYTHWVDLCETLFAAATACGGVYNHALREYKNPQYSQSERMAVADNLNKYSNLLCTLRDSANQIGNLLQLSEISTYRQYKTLSELCDLLCKIIVIPSAVTEYKELPMYGEKITAVCVAGKRKDTVREELCSKFSEQIVNFDAETTLLHWKQAEGLWFLPKIIKKSKISKAVKLYALNQKEYDKRQAPRYLELISEYHKCENIIKESSEFLYRLFGVIFDNRNWQLIDTITSTAIRLQNIIRSISRDSDYQNTAIKHISPLIEQDLEHFKNVNRTNWEQYSTHFAKITELENELSQQFSNNFQQWHYDSNWISDMSEKSSRWSRNLESLRDYCSYLQLRATFEAEGLQNVYEVLENGEIKENALIGSFIKSISKKCAVHVIDSTPLFSDFRGALFTQKIDKLKSLNAKYETLTKQELAARLSAQIPVLATGVSSSSEPGILQRAIKSGGRMMPIRKLFENIPNLLRKLSPCMLMSPISVAQYLDPKYPPFDLVVFDEASQIPTSEAVGAIARGKELIVVGDPKQLPPTSFFSSNQVDENNIEKEDLESVLDDCLALLMPQEHLLWHYRSRHESLIAFSNRKYYDNKLYTFPSPNDMVSQVRLVAVEGFYDRGKTKQNKAEAEAVIREIIHRLSDPILKKRSIGVVTFSSVQQNLIADMLEAELSKHPELDEIANNTAEPLFIKNLENVQGDERDVILFSIGYGPDKQGTVALNFGPLNRDGGWRRLNVAVSRARYEMLIFSVLKPEQIDLNRTRAEGLVGLKSFLEFAAHGKSSLPEAYGAGKNDLGVIETIADRIKSLGYDVKTNIGCSGYHIDIGVVHPDDPSIYLLGILCDSVNYHSGGTALDRNSTQESVLRNLGWKVIRIWVLDWWDNPEKELGRIDAEIDLALNRESSEEPAEIQPIKNVSQPIAFEKIKIETEKEEFNTYELTKLPPVYGHQKDSEYFSSYESTGIIVQQINAVIAKEAPICRELLCRRVLEAWGISKIGARISRKFDSVFYSMKIKNTKTKNDIFFWSADMIPNEYDDFRVPISNDNKYRRNLEHIPPEEIASVVKFIINRQIGLLTEDLEREVSRIFGFARCTESMQRCIKEGISIAVKKNWAKINGDRVEESEQKVSEHL